LSISARRGLGPEEEPRAKTGSYSLKSGGDIAMKALLFDPYSGASGDMILGSLLDLGADEKEARNAVESVGCRLDISRQERSHISTLHAVVVSRERYESFEEAVSLIKASSLHGESLEKALRSMDILAEAESRVHGSDALARFHEVGARDALADIAGSCAALQSLEVERVLSLPVSVGGGFVTASHGLLPVPGPAAMEILRAFRIPWRGGPTEVELLTPTGAALLASLVDEFLPLPPLLSVERIGYGAGERELLQPNALRAMVVEIKREHLGADRVVQLETNVDDVTGEVLGNLIDLLMESGALDVSVIPVLMKKGRSGSAIRAIARQDDKERISRLMMRETGSLGVRVFPLLHRYVAEREMLEVDVAIGGRIRRAAAKASWLDDEVLGYKPEYEDCRRIAAETGLPLREIMRLVVEAAWRKGKGEEGDTNRKVD
jgi:uncharacterized protein (TIGR00299 family) protein